MKLEKIIARAKRMGNIKDGFVLCDVCDNPADEVALQMGWVGCGPCIFGESDALDPKRFIRAEAVTK